MQSFWRQICGKNPIAQWLQTWSQIKSGKFGRILAFGMNGMMIRNRRDVLYLQTNDAPIKPLIEKLQLIQNKNNWGYIFRFGILKINKIYFEYIAKAMELPDKKIHELLI